MEKLVSNIQPTDELVQLQDEVLRFKNLETDTRFLSNDFQLIMPTDAVADSPLLTFSIHPTILPRYTFLNSIFLSAKVQLLKRIQGESEWKACNDDDNIAPAPYLVDTMWQQVDILLNDKR